MILRALAFPSFGTDSASHSERHGVLPSEVHQQAIGDRRFDDNTHERVTAHGPGMQVTMIPLFDLSLNISNNM